ncbi:hypothetical protein [Staphylococcus gallinarum]|uniref:hypothetical protein n=1 Tax=Staphylococcus gallinarum TaxID=1293 RepID=UPI0030C1B7F4
MVIDIYDGYKATINGYTISFSIKQFYLNEEYYINIHHIKTKRQKYFRKTEEFYKEFSLGKKVKKNQVDRLLEIAGLHVGMSRDKQIEQFNDRKVMVMEITKVNENGLIEVITNCILDTMDKVAKREAAKVK